MKKSLLLMLIFSCFALSSTVALAEETLQDNNFELKTDRLTKEQKDDGKTKSFAVEDHLFEEETIQKLEKSKEEETKQRAKEVDNLFLSGSKKVKELDTKQLFTEKNAEKAVAKEGETSKSVSSPLPLWPIIIMGLIITAMALLIYHNRNRGN